MSAAVIAFGAVSALGRGAAAVSPGRPGQPATTCLAIDPELAAAGLVRPFAARAALVDDVGDRAARLLQLALGDCASELDAVLPGWRSLRIGLALGTSSGGLRSAEQLFARFRDPAHEPPPRSVAAAFYFAPVLSALDVAGLDVSPSAVVMGACAASTIALGLGTRWLDADACDLVLAGGFDAVGTLVAAGFEALRATTTSLPPRPFRLGRDGMALGEGAAVVALRSSRLSLSASVHVVGFGASCDAVHLTAPDRAGRGLAAAARAALVEAGATSIDLVSPHGSATPFSDAAEAKALGQVLGEAATSVVVHPFKAQVGHTLGASGVLETLTCAEALRLGVLPAAAGAGEIDADARVNLLATSVAGVPRSALKLSAAFGGANAALVLAREPTLAVRRPRAVFIREAVHVAELPSNADLAASLGWPVERVARGDALARWVLAAVQALVVRDGALTGAGIVVGESFATLETDASFFARIEERGARFAEPRKFPYTSPNAAAGDAAAAFGLTGPGFAVGSGLQAGVEALVTASHLVAMGDAETVVVVAADDVGPTVSRMARLLGVDAGSGAIGLVVSAEPTAAYGHVGYARSGLARRAAAANGASGHRALLPLVGDSFEGRLAADSPTLGFACRGWAEALLRRGIDAPPLGF